MDKVYSVAICLLLIAGGAQTARLKTAYGDLALLELKLQNERENATTNWTEFNHIKSDLNSSLNSCYGDYKKLSDSFDSYRKITASSLRAATRNLINGETDGIADQVRNDAITTTCTIGGSNALTDALNRLND